MFTLHSLMKNTRKLFKYLKRAVNNHLALSRWQLTIVPHLYIKKKNTPTVLKCCVPYISKIFKMFMCTANPKPWSDFQPNSIDHPSLSRRKQLIHLNDNSSQEWLYDWKWKIYKLLITKNDLGLVIKYKFYLRLSWKSLPLNHDLSF